MTNSASRVSTVGSDRSDDSGVPIKPGQRSMADGALALGGMITSQTAFLGGLFYYFGWARVQATLSYFGVDITLVDYSFSEYLLRSIGITFLPFTKVVLALLVLWGIYQFVVQRWLERRVDQRFVAVAYIIAVALVTLVIVGVLVPDQIGLPLGRVLPLLLVGSVAVFGYALHLHSTYTKASATRQPSPTGVALVLLTTLGLLGMVWAVGLHADQAGKRIATDIVADLAGRPAVVLYSTERIAVAGTGVHVAEIAQPDSKYRYQYSGIRLLARSTDKYLLLPVSWYRGRDRVFIVPDDDSIRIDLTVKCRPMETDCWPR